MASVGVRVGMDSLLVDFLFSVLLSAWTGCVDDGGKAMVICTCFG